MARKVTTKRKLIVTAIAWTLGILIFFPILWTFLTSFKSEADAIASPPQFLFFHWTTENYAEVQSRSNYLSHFMMESNADSFNEQPVFAAELFPHRSLGRRGFKVLLALSGAVCLLYGMFVLAASGAGAISIDRLLRKRAGMHPWLRAALS